MTEQVLISIQGVQVIENEAADSPELMTTGTYSREDEINKVVYEEQLDDTDGVTVNQLLFSENRVELKKEGQIQSHMVFEKGKKSLSYYHTPYGSISVAMTANEVEVAHLSGEIAISLEYGIEMNSQHMADCALKIRIRENPPADGSD